MDVNSVTKELIVSNVNGLHVRPASLFVQMASSYPCTVEVENLDSQVRADGKSIMSMLMLAAPRGTHLRLVTTGVECQAAMNALEELVNRGFDE